ncbi:succinate dehydrogenase/fumarate reductase flavoprotein [Colletotrichum caudatum]|nr:succinate dehydrogenase/fumarate reductase flavoprotein [Colletotrichum caudatum]
MVIEQTDKVGATTAYSGGTVWIPQNSISKAAGFRDSRDAARQYLQDSLAQSEVSGLESSPARIEAFLNDGPQMVDFFQRLGLRWRPSPIPDYHPEVAGAMNSVGRTLDPCPFDAGTLGCWADRLRRSEHSAPAAYFHDFFALTKPYASATDLLTVCWMRLRAFFRIRTMARRTYMGSSLVAQLLGICLRSGGAAAGMKLDTKLKDLMVEGGAVRGADVESEGDTGDVLEAACRVGAATSLMGEACQGCRIFSEADPYGDVGPMLYQHCGGANAAVWLILDWNHRQRYTLGSLGPRAEPVDALANGHIFEAADLTSLAIQIGIEAAGLLHTVERWDQMCEDGVDRGFGKGKSKYHLFVGDRSAKWPNMGPLDKAPYYALQVTPGDAGTRGGLLTDEHGRVVDESGDAIAGLYAVGNSTASVMGSTSLGAEVTLGPAMTFARLAVLHMFERRKGNGL